MFGDLGKVFGATNMMGFSTALSLGDTLLSSYLGRKNTEHAHNLNQDAYSKRYQMTVNDMRRAGLNPILAATQGISGGVPGAVPSYAPSNIASTGTDVYRNSIEEQRVRTEALDQISRDSHRAAEKTVFEAEAELKRLTHGKVNLEKELIAIKQWTEQMNQDQIEAATELTQEKVNTEILIQESKKFRAHVSEKAYDMLKGPLSGVEKMLNDPIAFIQWLIRAYFENFTLYGPWKDATERTIDGAKDKYNQIFNEGR